MSEPLRDYDESAAWLGVSRKWLEKEVQQGRAPHVNFGRRVMFTQQDLDQIVNAHHKRGGPAPTLQVGTGPRPSPRGRRR